MEDYELKVRRLNQKAEKYKKQFLLLKEDSEKQIEILKKRIRFLENKPEPPSHYKLATLQEIAQIVSEHCQVSYNDVVSRSRKREFIIARFIAYKIAREQFKYTQGKIGLGFSNRDHSSVIHGINTITDWLEMGYQPENKYYNAALEQIKETYFNPKLSERAIRVFDSVC